MKERNTQYCSKMSSTRLVQLSLLIILLVLETSFAHTQLGILRKTGGRKILVNQLLNQGSNKMPDGSVSKISGNGAIDLKNVTLEVPEKHHMNVQVETLEPKAESQEFVDAANKVANLMWRDYSGRARRKPPIHNYNPTIKH
ncbi:uncharacterized protein LOC132037716 [Lycium ferocissimum]|uniref:uncharacterized protein LOC132037716 n=1 Tax=Lycium ferocissimum TaxID=112874 RepID=UPI00281589EF|nr:uncharacterized protein LOC132037716 [Lycium ferocissimum]